MRRREFIALLGSAAIARPLGARAQQASNTYRIGWLHPARVPDAWLGALRDGLREVGYIEGKNLVIEYRWGDGNFDLLPGMATDLVRLNVDVIVSGNTAALPALSTRSCGGRNRPTCRSSNRPNLEW